MANRLRINHGYKVGDRVMAEVVRTHPFVLTCAACGNDGPDARVEADREGWTNIEYDPEGVSWNDLGTCPHCQEDAV